MIQQINLFSEIFEPKKVVFPLSSMVLVSLSVLLLNIPLYFWMVDGHKQLENSLEQTKATTEELKKTVKLMREQAKRNTVTTELDEKIRDKQIYLAHARILFKQIVDEMQRSKKGFFDKLNALSKNIIEGLWLTNIAIDQSFLTLSGKSVDSNFIPVWISGFSNTPGLRETRLTKLEILKDDDSVVAFEISNKRIGNDR